MLIADRFITRLRRQYIHHPHLPQYHFVPPANLLNDPNGLIQWQGKYHLFYQYNPNGAFHGSKHWGHAISTDLINWRDLPIALTPTPHSPDSSGCWSGSALNWNGVPAVMYTGTQGVRDEIQTQCLATSDDDELIVWKKHPGNPVIADVPAETGQTRNFRDPYVFKDGDGWSLVLASQIVGRGGVLFLYHSTDLLNWQYLRPLLLGGETDPGGPWECPNLFRIDDKHGVIYSAFVPDKRVYYHVGRYENHKFASERAGIIDYGVLYAPLVFRDEAGRQILFGWIEEERPTDIQKIVGWSGAITLPRELQIDAQGRLRQRFVDEVNQLRNQHHTLDAATQPAPSERTLLPVTGRQLEVQLTVRPPSTGHLVMRLLHHPEDTEYTDVILDFEARHLRIDRTHASLDPDVATYPHDMSLAALEDDNWHLRMFIDNSVLEILVNEQLSLTARVYPARSTSEHISLINNSDAQPVITLDVWTLSSIWSYVLRPEIDDETTQIS